MKAPIHFDTGKPGTYELGPYLCGEPWGNNSGVKDIDQATCPACRQKYFGFAGTDPDAPRKLITD